jgi:hypothetical protein
MPEPELKDRRVLVLECVAVSAIFGIVAVVLYMVFSFQPA